MPSKLDQAKDPNTSTDVLEELSTDSDPEVRLFVGAHPSTSSRALVRLSEDREVRPRDDYAVCSKAVNNPHLPVEQLVKLSYSNDDWVRNCVARNLSATPEILDRLAEDLDTYVQHFALQNPHVEVATLVRLASKTPRISAMNGIAENPNTPAGALLLLIAKGSVDTAWHAARNPNATPEILEELALHVNGEVRKMVARHHKTPPLVKIWLQGGYGEMSLEEFLKAAR